MERPTDDTFLIDKPDRDIQEFATKYPRIYRVWYWLSGYVEGVLWRLKRQ
jgi:hypothetical protein